MIIPYALSLEDVTDVGPTQPVTSRPHSTDNMWNRSFHGHQGARTLLEEHARDIAHAMSACYQATRSLIQSCVNKYRNTQFKRRCASASHASGTSELLPDKTWLLRSETDTGEKDDGAKTEGKAAFERWDGGKGPDWKSGLRTSEEARHHI